MVLKTQQVHPKLFIVQLCPCHYPKDKVRCTLCFVNHRPFFCPQIQLPGSSQFFNNTVSNVFPFLVKYIGYSSAEEICLTLCGEAHVSVL